MKILFISHDVSRTGAPLILLHIIKWIKQEKPQWQLHLLALERGKLESEFRKETSKFFDFTNTRRPLKPYEMFTDKTLGKLGLLGRNKEERLLDEIGKTSYDLIYANSIVSLPIAVRLKQRIPEALLCSHVHELNTIIQMAVPEISVLKDKTDHFIAVSFPVRQMLVNNYKIAPDKISLFHEFAVVEGSQNLQQEKKKSFIVGSSGTAHWRKGSDLFLLVAASVYRKVPEAEIEFTWIGGNAGHEAIIENDIKKLGLTGRVNFTGEIENPSWEYSTFDLFLLTSREDPFPLVSIEMAMLEKPIICFEQASGSAGFVEKGGGRVVPYLDIEAMAEEILYYYRNPQQMIIDGRRNKELFSAFKKEKICPKILGTLEKLLS